VKRGPSIAILLLLWLITGLGWVWTSTLWQEVWVDRALSFYPPEWRNTEEMARLNAEAPLYRENDTYYWVYLTLESQQDERVWGSTQLDGSGEERPVRWSPILPALLSFTGSIHSAIQNTPVTESLFWTGHWLNPWLGWLGCGLLSFLIYFRFGLLSGGLFLLLTFSSPPLQWVFAASRLDHHSLQVLLAGMQLLAFAAALVPSTRPTPPRPIPWGLLAGISTALGIAVSASPQILLSAGITLAAALFLLTARSSSVQTRSFFIIFGISGAISTVLFCVFWSPSIGLVWDITTLHPLHGIAILGSGLFLSGVCRGEEFAREPIKILTGLILGLVPAFWILFLPSAGHVWMIPFVERMHQYISDYRSPLLEGYWYQSLFWLPILTLFAAVLSSLNRSRVFPLLVATILLLLAIWQRRWLAEFSIVAILCLSISSQKGKRIAGSVLVILSFSLWAWQWSTIRENPGQQFSADLLLRTLGRDVALNIERYSMNDPRGKPARVAMVYDFAPQTLAFSGVKPIGSLYWENWHGTKEMAQLFDERDPHVAMQLARKYGVDFLVVQPRGQRFAEMNQAMNATADGSTEPSFATRLSLGVGVPSGLEKIPFSGTFDPRRVDAVVYRVLEENK